MVTVTRCENCVMNNSRGGSGGGDSDLVMAFTALQQLSWRHNKHLLSPSLYHSTLHTSRYSLIKGYDSLMSQLVT